MDWSNRDYGDENDFNIWVDEEYESFDEDDDEDAFYLDPEFWDEDDEDAIIEEDIDLVF